MSRPTRLLRAPWLAAVSAALAIGIAAEATAQGGPASVLAERVERREITDTVPIHAELVASTRSEVAARTPGIADEVLFRVGDRVERGALLVRLDRDLIDIRRRTAEAALETARAGIAVAEAQMRQAEQAYERQSGLRGSTAFSRGAFEDLEAAAAQGRAELSRAQARATEAEAALAAATYDQRHAEIRAPFAGVVIERSAQPGSYVELGEAVATLLDTDTLEIEASLPVRLVEAVEPGTRVAAVFEGGAEIEAELRSLLPVEVSETRTRPARFTADLGDLGDTRLAAGKSLILRMPVSAPRVAVTVPKDALVQARGGWRVFTVENGEAVPRSVVLGEPVGARMEVLSGLLPGDVVVVRGNERLRPGQPVSATMTGGASDEGVGAPAARRGGGADGDGAEVSVAPARQG